MNETLVRALQLKITYNQWKVLGAVLAQQSLSLEEIRDLTGLHKDRVLSNAEDLYEMGLIKKTNKGYGILNTMFKVTLPHSEKLHTKFSNVEVINTVKPSTLSDRSSLHSEKKGSKLNTMFKTPTHELFAVIVEKLGRTPGKPAAEMAALKAMYAEAYAWVKDEEFRDLQAFGLVKDAVEYYLADEWVQLNASLPACLFRKKFPAFLKLVGKKPLSIQRDEAFDSRRFRKDMDDGGWLRTKEDLPRSTKFRSKHDPVEYSEEAMREVLDESNRQGSRMGDGGFNLQPSAV